MDDESGELSGKDNVTGAGRGVPETETEMRIKERSRELKKGRDNARYIERNDQVFLTRTILVGK